MIRKSKLYSRPQKPFESSRIQDENILTKKYALKNKKEVWKASAKINYFRKRAMTLAAQTSEDQQKIFFNKLKNLGLKVESTADVLDLKVEDLLNRRLPTIVTKKGISNSVKHARQLVVHKKIIINNKVVNTPSYIVPITEEKDIKLKEKKTSKKSEQKNKESINSESLNNKDLSVSKTSLEIKSKENLDMEKNEKLNESNKEV